MHYQIYINFYDDRPEYLDTMELDWKHLLLRIALTYIFTTFCLRLCQRMENLSVTMGLHSLKPEIQILVSTTSKVSKLFLEESFVILLWPIYLFQDQSKSKVSGSFQMFISMDLKEADWFFRQMFWCSKYHLDKKMLTVEKTQFFSKETLWFIPNVHATQALSF